MALNGALTTVQRQRTQKREQCPQKYKMQKNVQL